MLSRPFPPLLLLLLLPLLLPSWRDAGAQVPVEAEVRFEYRAAGWEYALDSAARTLERPDLDDTELDTLQASVQQVSIDTAQASTEARRELERVNRLMDTLGAPPDADTSSEEPRIAEERKRLREQLTLLQARQQQAELAAARARQINERISATRRTLLAEALQQSGPSPLAPDVLSAAAQNLVDIVRGVLTADLVTWMPLLGSDASEELRARALAVAAVWAVLLVVGYRLRRWLLARYVRDRRVADPSYARRVKAAAAAAVARGVVPVLVGAGPLVVLLLQRERTGLWADVVVASLTAALLVTVVYALGRAVLAPYSPSAWRLVPLTDKSARRVFRRTVALAAVLGIAFFLEYSVKRTFEISQELAVTFNFVVDTAIAVYLLLLAQPSLWQPLDPQKAAEEGRTTSGRRGRSLWPVVRYALWFVAPLIPVVAVLGYSRLARFLASNVAFTMVLIAALLLVARLGRDVAAVALSADGRAGDDRDKAADTSAHMMQFWLTGALDLVLVVVAVLVLLPLWGVAWQDLQGWLLQAVQGIRIGSFTLSLSDMLMAVVLFVVILLVTRTVQHVLEERVFPQTRLDPGVRNSLKTATGYVGLVLAAGVAVTVVGLDLSQVTIVLGALSVGIGFGLQAIVNNFVSGLILLVERPVKVGDWVVVGAHSGYVRRIKVRATELETFQLASVFIPNSELISNSLINWLHKDPRARVEVRVGVQHGTDPALVRDLLLECARAHPMAVKEPAPFVLFMDLGSSSLDFEIRLFIRQADFMIAVASDMRFAIVEAFKQHGIRIAFPQLDVHMGRRLSRPARDGADAAGDTAGGPDGEH